MHKKRAPTSETPVVDFYWKFDARDEITCSHPNDWFKRNPGKKPSISVSYTQSKPALRECLVRSLYAEIKLKKINTAHALTFLYVYAKDSMKERLNEDWKSYSLTIGLQGSVITPLNIIDVDLKDFEFKNLKETNVELPSSDDWLAFYLCTIYRLNKAPSDEQRKIIANLARKEILKISQHSSIRVLQFNKVMYNGGLAGNVNYVTLIAAYDMFLHKFPNNSAKFCRFATNESRLRDCAALSSFFKAFKCLGMENHKDLTKWTFYTVLNKQIERLWVEKEYSDEYSYFMYQVDFRLVVGSTAYSASAKPFVYFFCNIIAALCLDESGLRAKKKWDPLVNITIIGNAILIAYIYRQRTSDEKIDELEPKSRNTGEWLHFMLSRKWKLTDNMINWFKDRRSKMVRTSAETVGYYLQNIEDNFLSEQLFPC